MLLKVTVLFLGLICAVIPSHAEKRGVLLTVPRIVRPGSPEKACLVLHQFSEGRDVDLQLFILQNENTITSEQHSFRHGNGRCFDMSIPRTLDTSEVTLVARVASFGTQPYTFQANTTLGVKQESLITFIQTDKPIYKPGQTVRFRILSVDSDLKPKIEPISEVWVENPAGIRMAQWLNVPTELGLASLNMELSEEPPLGKWKISAIIDGNTQRKTFDVEEYVLPKYEVTIEMPNYVLVNSPVVEGNICARYTYGKPVKGYVNATACVQQQYFYRRYGKRPCIHFHQSIDGCATFSIPTAALQLSSSRYSLSGAKLNVTAVVHEDATGVMQNTSVAHTTIEQRVMILDISSHSPNYYKPRLRYHGKILVKHPDDSPVASETVEVTVSDYGTGFRVAKNYTSDRNGEVRYTLPALPDVDAGIVQFTVNAKLPGHEYRRERGKLSLHVPQAYFGIKQWYSPSGSFLQIEPVYDTVNCNSSVPLNITYTTSANTNFKFYYQIISRGNIIHSGSRRHHFKGHDELQMDERTHGRSRGPKKGRRQESTEDALLPKHVAHFILNIPIDHEMSPLAKVLVFYVTDDGETVADSFHIPVQQCLENKVSVSFDQAQKRPGQPTTVRVQSDPHSLCAVGVVDKSVHILGGNNQLSIHKAFDRLKMFETQETKRWTSFDWRLENEYCERKLNAERNSRNQRRRGRGPFPPGPAVPLRSKRSSWMGMYYSQYFDSMKAFRSVNVKTITDLVMESRPCKIREHVMFRKSRMRLRPNAVGLSGAPGPVPERAYSSDRVDQAPNNEIADSPEEEDTLDIRNYFPETWLWELYHSGDSGMIEVEEEIPHTITEWIASAVCSNENSGLGISQTATIKAFQPFFVSFTLPYSAIRGETIPVKVTVFNYLEECIVVRLQLDNSNSFGSRNRGPHDVCVCGDDAETHTFLVTAYELGEVNITVRAESVDDSIACGNKIRTRVGRSIRDTVTRPLLIEPEGVEEEYTFSNFMCPSEGDVSAVEARLELPNNVVLGSARAQVTAIGDVMGPSLSGLDKLLRVPVGCGEQNMLGFTPNIFVLQYLSSSNQLTSEVESKAKANMKIGYQRELQYRHNDGSYSAFGNNDDSGSMWLTAFVVKSFAQAKPYIFIDENDLQRSIDWFKTKQLENGCFPQVGRVIHKSMKGGLSTGGDAALTAYVLAAMLEAGIPTDDRAVTDALLCLNSQNVNDVYSLSLMAYAYTLYDRTSNKRRDVMRLLNQRSIVTDGTLHWETETPKEQPPVDGWIIKPYHQAASADVETTAYALMAHVLNSDRNTVIADALPIVRWLTKQRNSDGGFSSTQDTIVALQALADYAGLVYSEGTNLDIEVSGQSYARTFTISDQNRLLLQRDAVLLPNLLSMSASGSGCALVQANVKYNIPTNSTTDDAFDLKVNVGRVNSNCMKRSLNVCIRYTALEETSNMAVVSVKMVTGWLPRKRSIQDLMQDTTLMLKRYDVDKNWVHLYFDEFGNIERCITFQVEQDLEVSDAKPGIVHVYDYYDTAKSAQEDYNIQTTCGTKEELPHLTQQEYDRITENNSFVGQVRVPLAPAPPRRNTQCPICYTEVPADVRQKFCSAEHVYKAVPKKSKLKLLYDMRPEGARRRLHTHAKYLLGSECDCDVIKGKEKLLLMTKEAAAMNSNNNFQIALASPDVLIMPADKRTEKLLNKLKNGRGRKNSCRRFQ